MQAVAKMRQVVYMVDCFSNRLQIYGFMEENEYPKEKIPTAKVAAAIFFPGEGVKQESVALINPGQGSAMALFCCNVNYKDKLTRYCWHSVSLAFMAFCLIS